MSSKRDLHTLFIKHDTDFGTLSKKALSEVILKIIFFQNGGTRIGQIKTELSTVIAGNVSDMMITESLKILEKGEKILQSRGKFSINPKIKTKLEKSANANRELQDRVFAKYLSGSQTPIETLKAWFKDALILFFENFSMEWFNHLTQNGKLSPKKIDNNVSYAIDQIIIQYSDRILEADKAWLKINFIKFYESDEYDENMMFWNFGMSMFSSRLITARNYADKISIETYKNGSFLLDTNILMILDLEAHEFGQSFNSLDKILQRLNIKTTYLHITGEEYKRAILGRKADTLHVFDSYDEEVLMTTKCPFVKTALARGCKTTEDVERMFDTLMDIPKSISSLTKIEKIDFRELEEVVERGCKDDELKKKINDICLKRLNRDKSENPKTHDAGLIHGVNYLRKSEPTWILTIDGTIKMFAIENVVRAESEIAIGLDALIAMFAVNNGGVDVDSSDFAPLFKSLIKNSLIPEDHVFDVRDLAFILSTNLRINDLESHKVIEIANEVRRMRITGQDDNDISLYLRREIEGQKLSIVSDLGKAKLSEGVARSAREKAEKERDVAYTAIRNNRRGELRDKYDRELRIGRILFFSIPTIIAVVLFFILKYAVPLSSNLSQFIVGCSVEFIFGIAPLWFINNRLVRKYSEYVTQIESLIEKEIIEAKRNVD
jgi:hypothetical protein